MHRGEEIRCSNRDVITITGGVQFGKRKNHSRETSRLLMRSRRNFAKAPATVVADYRGLNVAQVTELRKQLREADIEFQVLKNSLVRRATASAELTELDAVLDRSYSYCFQ